MTEQNTSKITVHLTVRQSVTVLPRCLQILSRRGYKLLELHTTRLDDSTSELTMVIEGNAGWHHALPHLLQRVVEVDTVKVATGPETNHAR